MSRDPTKGPPVPGGQAHTLIIKGILPNLNDYINAERRNKHAAAAMKRQTEHTVMVYAKSQLRGLRFTGPVRMDYTWYEPNRRRDKDNVSSFGRKCIQDALVKSGFLQNDGWAEIDSFSDAFAVDPKTPRIEVEIRELPPSKPSKDRRGAHRSTTQERRTP